MAHWLRRLPLFLFWLAGVDCRAETISWYSVAGAINDTAAGASMTGSFDFELGVFADNFVPTASNMAQWAANWVPAQRVAYNQSNHRFDGQFTVEDNIAPFTIGKPAYVWGFRADVAASEWILFRKSDWNWPAPNPMGNPIYGPHWNATDATAIVGSIHPGRGSVLMKSAVVSGLASPPTTWAQWQDEELGEVLQNGPGDDPDHDGTSNLMEFVFGTPPNQSGPGPLTSPAVATVSSQQYLQMTIPRRIDHAALLTVEVSPDLIHWTSGPAETVVVSDSPSAWVVRDLTALAPNKQQRFMRLKAELATP